jgi:hypothetical protein
MTPQRLRETRSRILNHSCLSRRSPGFFLTLAIFAPAIGSQGDEHEDNEETCSCTCIVPRSPVFGMTTRETDTVIGAMSAPGPRSPAMSAGWTAAQPVGDWQSGWQALTSVARVDRTTASC